MGWPRSTILNFNSRPSARGDAKRGSIVEQFQFQFTPLREGRRASAREVHRAEDFNSRPSARGDGRGGITPQKGKDFNSRPSARGDFEPGEEEAVPAQFQFTPLREGRLAAAPKTHSRAFQFTPLREGRPLLFPRKGRNEEDFNSRPSARGDVSTIRELYLLAISIHAPPRGATFCGSVIICQ